MSTIRLSDTLSDGVSSVFFSEGFQMMLENHILRLVRSSSTAVVNVPDSQAYQYEADFFGLLLTLGVPSQYHFTTMRCNNLYSPADYRSTLTSIIVPGFSEIDELFAIYTTSTSLSMG